MRLYLIRHGETVDNVAGIYAGSRDSALTNHGFQQATRLGQHFQTNGIRFTHIFSSPLQRTLKTAELVRHGQLLLPDVDHTSIPRVKPVPELIEQDFGYYEGKNWTHMPSKGGKHDRYEQHRAQPGFKEPESVDSMAARMDSFLSDHLFPLLREDTTAEDACVAIVSHGLAMPVMWQQMILHLPFKSLTAADHLIEARGTIVVDRLGGWSNTGYLELDLQRTMTDKFYPGAEAYAEFIVDGGDKDGTCSTSDDVVAKPKRSIHQFTVTITAINSVEHLKGLKRTGGGVGSSKHDEAQKTIDTFFKRRRVS
ncbi:PGAM-domain-containing protein [Rhizodiscina lignyota]|uniref:PGAM-domain-containing protein n=1 Tax=Rhizodiscina lignyota TaxID=1504668 RepID=A0A9P4I5X8_9PEZI|nr:PGAM-domain-containing protein [Rhizodiscina lignyota]